MADRLDLSKLRNIDVRDWEAACEREAAEEYAHRLAQAMSAPLMRAIDNWNRRFSEGITPSSAEEDDLDDRIRDEDFLLYAHGCSVMSSYGPFKRRSASVSWRTVDIVPAHFGYEVFSLDDLALPQPGSVIRYAATGGGIPGEFELARDHAESLGGVVLRRCLSYLCSDDHTLLKCVHVSERITPQRAYDAFMRMYDDGWVIDRFLAVFERLRNREHRNMEARADRRPEHYQNLGEIAFYLAEVRSWRDDRDCLLAQGKI
ncbi:hypothetical protein NKG99_07160 [Mesorhizobium sp. M1409]|uniref:hypothetical protein n=1 Tax=unclassified Mesorhizobium TaxID=325217 RepID=UPI003335FBD3